MNTCPACHNQLEECDCFDSVFDEADFKKHSVKTPKRSYGLETPPIPGIKHGSGGYNKGCRCTECRQARAQYQREWIKK